MSILKTSVGHSRLLAGTAACAFLWVVVRAFVQSVTIDEADTYLFFAGRAAPSHWEAAANNHLLNSILMRLVTSVFGASAFTLRVPALVGSGLYIGAVYYLALLVTPRRLLQWSILVCLTCSPFLMDYLVAARGYSLAAGFLMLMLAVGAAHHCLGGEAREARLRQTGILISICAALCISANFSFAIAAVSTGLGLFLWLCRSHPRNYLKIFAACTLPGLAVACFLFGSVVVTWPKGQFTWGSESWDKTLQSVLHASLYEPNEYLLNPILLQIFAYIGPYLYPILATLMVCRLVALVAARTTPAGLAASVSVALTIITGGALLMSLAGHQALFMAYGILLPFDRTAIFLVVLFLLMAGSLASIPLSPAIARVSGKALTASLALVAVYSVGCLRLNYFAEWKYDADMKRVYAILAYYNREYGVTRISTNWRYVSALNWYRQVSGREDIEEIPGGPTDSQYPPGYQAYVMHWSDEAYFNAEGLKIVYHDPFTDVTVGIRPEVEKTRRLTGPR